MAGDTQVVEILGRNRLIGEILSDDLEVSLPVRDRGIDLIAYAELNRQVERFVARPIQMKASTRESFGVARKYTRIADLILAYVWNVGDPARAVTYAMPYTETVRIAEAMGWTETESWTKDGGAYVTNSPSKRLLALLEPYRTGPGRWWSLVVGGAPDGGTIPRATESGS